MNTGFENVEISPSPVGLEREYSELFTDSSIKFVADLVDEFQERIFKILENRKLLKLSLTIHNELPKFSTAPEGSEVLNGVISSSENNKEEDWSISPLPVRLQNRQLDLGDVSPSNEALLRTALLSKVQGIQVDFDDSHCPTWCNMIKGIHNVVAIVNGKFCPQEVPKLEEAPVLLLRPRAWNMNEHNLMVNGKEVPGALMDFGLLIYHIGVKTTNKGVGPFFYLPKLESAIEAKLWDDIFSWAENTIGLEHGTIKSCVLIENILAAFEMEEILFELRHHSFGLNCGIWDYSASIVSLFGTNEKFLLPDRDKYANMDEPFLNKYMKLVVQTCHKHGAPATGGMIPYISDNESTRNEIIEKIFKAKLKEIELGVDGFLTYDPSTVPFLQDFWTQSSKIQKLTLSSFKVTANELLDMPKGGVTVNGLQKNIKVGMMFIYSWLAKAKGHFILDGCVEDSATAEISRSQVWQCIYHQVRMEDEPHEKITKALVSKTAWEIYEKLLLNDTAAYDKLHLRSACEILLEVVTAYEFPPFITTFLYNHSTFRHLNKT